MKPFSARTLLIALALSVSALAQMPMPKPSAELKKLDYFVGNWTMDADAKPGLMGPGGKMSLKEKNEWMDGGFFVIVHSRFSSEKMGSGTGISLMGYNPEDKTYFYDEYNSMGEAARSTGTNEGDTWTWMGEQKMGPQVMKGRFIMKILSPTAYNFKYEISTDGATWNLVMEGKATKS
ncbi:MAG TPA: DUF1579 family protein [Terriglobales bacterium]|nr:DUF1579 family protein [Terriglobales bacterium]